MKFLKNGTLCESDIQKQAIQWVSKRPYKDLVIHVANEGKRSERYGAHLKAMGLRPGAWDIQLLTARHGYIGAWIEVKSQDGKLSPNQLLFGEDMRKEGYYTAVVYNVDETIKTIHWYMTGNKTVYS